MASLKGVFVVREAADVRSLPAGSAIEILDRSPGSGPEGHWLQVRILRRWSEKGESGYEYRAPWSSSGEGYVYDIDYGKSWRLVDVN